MQTACPNKIQALELNYRDIPHRRGIGILTVINSTIIWTEPTSCMNIRFLLSPPP
jgi:hypothetical protein